MKFITKRQEAATTVVTASTRWAPATAAELGAFLRPELEDGETMPDLELLQKLFGRALARRWNLLDAVDDAHVSATVRHRRLLAERAAAVKALHRGVVDLRRLIRGIFGAEPARRLLALGGKTSSDPVILVKQAERTVERLLDAPLHAGEASIERPRGAFEPSELDRERWAAPVSALARTLEAARARASVATKELEAAAAERRRAIESFNAALARVAGWLAGTYRAAGRDVCAEAVRPSGRCPGLLLKNERRGTPTATTAGPTRPVAVKQGPSLGHEPPPPIPAPSSALTSRVWAV